MKAALEAIMEHVALHGAMPSRRTLAKALGCNANNANRLIACLVERGEVNTVSQGGALAGFGHDGIAVFVPPHLASQLAAFCGARGEKFSCVVTDAISLHLDAAAGPVRDAEAAE